MRVRDYLSDPAVEASAARAQFVKAAIMGGVFVSAYGLGLVASTPSVVCVAAVIVGISLAGLAFNVQHDGGHGAFSQVPMLNRAASKVLDLLGMSSYLWRWKHNRLHHGNPNVIGLDDDVDAAPYLRLHPGQAWRPWHRFQHYYCWLLYSLATLRWALVSDFVELRRGQIGTYQFPSMTSSDKCLFWASKAQFLGWAVVVPWYCHGWLLGLCFFLIFELTGGLIASVCFQLAHAVDEAEHTTPEQAARLNWVERQLGSTVDFSAGPILRWYLGGLNHQAVHHLFPGVRHTHYAVLARELADAAGAHGLLYKRGSSLTGQIRSHCRLMKRLGSPGAGSDRAGRIEAT